MNREQWHIVISLVLVAVVATLLLGITHSFTSEPIARARKASLHRALQQVLPPHANDPQKDAVRVGGEQQAVKVFPARDADGNVVGLAWEVVAPDGYSGSIRILVGVMPDGRIYAIKVTDHRETPGLGDGIVRNQRWINSFSGRTLERTRWAVKKDGGDFDQFTGATITPRAVVRAVHQGLLFFRDQRQEIMRQLAGKDHGSMGARGGQ